MNIEYFLNEISKRSIAPKNIQFSNWNEWTIVSAFMNESNRFISEDVTMGIDKNPKIALMKCLTEFVERNVFKNSDEQAAKITDRSDGFAAYPAFLPNSKENARKNAFNEAVERYLWSTWWDNQNIFFRLEEETSIDNRLREEFKLNNIFKIKVLDNNSKVTLLILLAENKKGGFLTGGAAGLEVEQEETYSRAFGELLRHLLVNKKIDESTSKKLTFYEKRLIGFGSGKWRNSVISRIGSTGNKEIFTPELIIDKEIEHENSDLVTVHRCLLKDQPIFMGGRIERLCI